MNVVVDTNLVAAIVLPLPYSDRATQKFIEWKRASVELLVPSLLEYEVAAVLRKAVVADLLAASIAVEAMRKVLALNFQSISPTLELHERALRWADRLGHSKTYYAHYLALAEQSQADLWTADRRLANGAQQADATWVHWIEEGA